jgi:hypothetical protein
MIAIMKNQTKASTRLLLCLGICSGTLYIINRFIIGIPVWLRIVIFVLALISLFGWFYYARKTIKK